MDELANELVESLLSETAGELFYERLKKNHSGGSFVRRFRSNAEGIFRLGGLEGLQCWLDARMAAGTVTEDDLLESLNIRNSICYQVNRARSRVIKEHERQKKRSEYESLWLNLLARRDLKDRAFELKFNADPRQAILKRLQAAWLVT